MKIKIKSREEIKKTLWGRNHRYIRSCYFAPEMFEFCGKVFNAEPSTDNFSAHTPVQEGMVYDWYWHSDWYEVVEPDFTHKKT